MPHTPGPWKITGRNGDTIRIGNDVADVGDMDIVDVSEEEWKANACLVAAAPELLAAGEQMMAMMDNLMKAVPWGKTFELDIKLLNEAPLSMARAIAKAKGEAQ